MAVITVEATVNCSLVQKACKPSKTSSLVLFGPTVIGHSSGFPCQL